MNADCVERVRMLRFLTAGESHGPYLTAIIEGFPAGVVLDVGQIARDLARRQMGYGRGDRMKIEQDRAEVLSGVAQGTTTGAPIALRIENRDWSNWQGKELAPLTVPRPGHADLAGAQKYGLQDVRLVLERASARETAARVAVGAVAKSLLSQFEITVYAHVLSIGRVQASRLDITSEQLRERLEGSSLLCADRDAENRMRREIDEARAGGNSLGGVFEVVAENVPPGLGSHVHWDRRLDGRLAQAVMSIPAIKGVEIGAGFDSAQRRGTEMHDEIFYEGNRIVRRSNRAGGIEGGISNGEAIVVRAAMKPIPTTVTPLRTIDLATRKQVSSRYQRSDVCAVPAAAVIGEAMVAWVLADAMVEKFGGDSLQEMLTNFANYVGSVARQDGDAEASAEMSR